MDGRTLGRVRRGWNARCACESVLQGGAHRAMLLQRRDSPTPLRARARGELRRRARTKIRGAAPAQQELINCVLQLACRLVREPLAGCQTAIKNAEKKGTDIGPAGELR